MASSTTSHRSARGTSCTSGRHGRSTAACTARRAFSVRRHAAAALLQCWAAREGPRAARRRAYLQVLSAHKRDAQRTALRDQTVVQGAVGGLGVADGD